MNARSKTSACNRSDVVLLMVCWIGTGKSWSWVIALKANYPTPKSRSLFRQVIAKHPGRAPGTCSTKEIEDDRKEKSVSTIGNGVLPIIGTKRFACAEPGDRSEISAHPMRHVITGNAHRRFQRFKWPYTDASIFLKPNRVMRGNKNNST